MMGAPQIILAAHSAVRAPAGAVVVSIADRAIYGDGPRRWYRTQSSFRFATAMLVNLGRIVTSDEMVDHIWGDRADGGPEAVKRHLSYYVFWFNRRSRLFLISNPRGFGFLLELRASASARLAA